MSWWTDFRDTLQSIATVVVNYYYPGSGFLVNKLHSKGSQEQMATGWGQLAMLGSGGFGAFGGNMANYGNTWNAMTGTNDAVAAGGTAGAGWGDVGSYSGGMTGGGAAQIDPQALEYAQSLMTNNGLSATEAYAAAGIDPSVLAGAAGGTGAGPTFQGQATAGAATTPGGAPLDAGTTNYFGGYPSAQAQDAAMGAKIGKSVGAMPWGSPGNVSSIGSGLYGLAQAGQMMSAAGQAQKQADPFGPYRQQYADLARDITSDPSKITTLPGYQAGMQAVQRSMAAQGYTGSGNMMSAMSKYGGDFYNNALQMYSGLGGAQFNPATGAQLGLQGQQYGVELAGRSLGSLGYGAQMAGNQWPWQQQRRPGG